MDGYYAFSSISTIFSGSGVVDVAHDASPCFSSPSVWNRMDMAAMIRRGMLVFCGGIGLGFCSGVFLWFLLPWAVEDPRWTSFNW